MAKIKIKKTKLANASKDTKAVVKVASERVVFFFGLNARTGRDLVKYPPIETEPIRNMGIGKTRLERIRRWINRDYRKPKNKRALVKGEIKLSTKYAKLKELAGV